jgi:hypothetical protein
VSQDRLIRSEGLLQLWRIHDPGRFFFRLTDEERIAGSLIDFLNESPGDVELIFRLPDDAPVLSSRGKRTLPPGGHATLWVTLTYEEDEDENPIGPPEWSYLLIGNLT